MSWEKLTKHGVELHWDQIQAAVRTVQVVLLGPNCMVEVWLSAKRVQHTNHTPGWCRCDALNIKKHHTYVFEMHMVFNMVSNMSFQKPFSLSAAVITATTLWTEVFQFSLNRRELSMLELMELRSGLFIFYIIIYFYNYSLSLKYF